MVKWIISVKEEQMELLTDEDLLLSYEKALALDDIDQVFITLLEEEIDKRGLLLSQAVTD